MKILDDLIESLAVDAPAREVRIGRFWTTVWSRHCGLASTTGPGDHKHGARFVEDAGSLAGRSALELARLAHSNSSLEAGVGLAAINSLLEVDQARCVELNAGDLLVERGRGKRVALIGHFPFVPALREAAAHLWVLELRPQVGDAGAEEANDIVPQADVRYARGCELSGDDASGLAEAAEAAAGADAAVVVVGLSQAIEGEEGEVENAGDRADLRLPSIQRKLLEAIHDTGTPMVVVLINGSALAVNWANENAAAIVEAWYPGEEGGTAVAEVLLGDYNPGGRLPVTFVKSVGQLPPFADYSMAGRTYRYMNDEPLYRFGHGLCARQPRAEREGDSAGRVHRDKR